MASEKSATGFTRKKQKRDSSRTPILLIRQTAIYRVGAWHVNDKTTDALFARSFISNYAIYMIV